MECGEKFFERAASEVHYQQHERIRQAAYELARSVLEIFGSVCDARCISSLAAGIADEKSDPIREEVEEEMIIKTLQQAKRVLRIVFGFTLLAIGVVMIVTPGPGTLTILLALGVLAAEFVWARRLLDRLKVQGTRLRETVFPRTDRAA